MYGYTRKKSLNTVRSLMLKKVVREDARLTAKSKVNLSRRLIYRLNHCLACYKRADQAIFWRPKRHDPGQGWEKNDSGSLEPIWSSSPILPASLVDFIEPSSEEGSDIEEETDQELDFSEVFHCDEDDRSMLTSKSFYVNSFCWKVRIPSKSMTSQMQQVHLREKKT